MKSRNIIKTGFLDYWRAKLICTEGNTEERKTSCGYDGAKMRSSSRAALSDDALPCVPIAAMLVSD